jgi:hypothetical protein
MPLKLTDDIVQKAITNTAKNNKDKVGVAKMLANRKAYGKRVKELIESGEYIHHLKYRPFRHKNTNGKMRYIKSPNLLTRTMQHVFLLLVMPYYKAHDNMNALNCKIGCGITAKNKGTSVIRKLKHIYYDRRDYEYALVIDQRKCYEHITPKAFRKEAKFFIPDKELIDFGVNVGFVDGCLPIGTPTSPVLHHFFMLRFDLESKQHYGITSIRYADDCIYFCHTKEEANQLKWRIKNFWWYELKARSKRAVQIIPLTDALSFCGYIVHRVLADDVLSHNKGYTQLRRNIKLRAIQCERDESWASYYGLMLHADMYRQMCRIETDMDLIQLTQKFKIHRSLDAKHIEVEEVLGKTFNVYDYEIRYKGDKPNWIKCLIGLPELSETGQFTGRMQAREFHGNLSFIYHWLLYIESNMSRKEFMPIRNVTMIFNGGYLFAGSTDMIDYIDDSYIMESERHPQQPVVKDEPTDFQRPPGAPLPPAPGTEFALQPHYTPGQPVPGFATSQQTYRQQIDQLFPK